MFANKKQTAYAEVPNTVIGKGITIEAASLTGRESVRIDGTFRGNVDIGGSLILGDTGNIEGHIHAKYIILAGKVVGDIQCDSTLHVASSANVSGNIASQSLIVDEGGQLNGQYKIGGEQKKAQPGKSDLTQTQDKTERTT